MVLVRKLLAAFLIGVALLVAVHFVFSSFYRETLDTIDVWSVLDWPIALALVVVLVVNIQRKRTLDRSAEENVTREYVEVNTATYATALVALWFFSNWFNFLSLGTEGESAANLVVWAIVDALIVLVLGATGGYLWRASESD